MMPRKSRRSSILKPPKQIVRAPLQDLDSDDDGTLTQPTSRRVSFSRTSQIKEFDPSIGYMSKWNQSYEESLDSIEGEENQAKSANVFDGLSSVQTQKKVKRKRTSTIQLSLNSSNIEASGGACSNLNQSLHQSSGTRAVKQPRKSLDCFTSEVVEEGDTAMFFDELNRTETIKCSHSNIETSTYLSTTLIDSTFNCSDAELGGRKINLPAEHLSESSSKSVGNYISEKLSGGGEVLVDAFPSKDPDALNSELNQNVTSKNYDSYMDMTVASGGIEVPENILNKLTGVPNGNMGSDAKKNPILDPMDWPREDGGSKINGTLTSSTQKSKNTELSAEMHGGLTVKCESLDTSEESMDLTLTGGKIEVGESFINIEKPRDPLHGSSKETVSNITLRDKKDDIKHNNSRDTSATVMVDNDHDDLLPLSSSPEKAINFRDSNETSDKSSSLEVSMKLTIPQVRFEAALSKSDYQEGNAQVCQSTQGNEQETEELEMTGTYGQHLEKSHSKFPSEMMNDYDIVRDKSESHKNVTNELESDEECVKEIVADSTASSDMELSMTNGGIVIQENVENKGLNITQGSDFSDEACADMEGMELTVPLGKLKMSKGRDDFETIDSLKPLGTNEVLMDNSSTTVAGENLAGLPKEIAKRSCVADAENTSYSGLDETCADMEMTVSLGVVRERILRSVSEIAMQNAGGISDSAPEEQLKLDEILRKDKEILAASDTKSQAAGTGLNNHEVLSHGESQVMNTTELEAVVMRKTVPLEQSHRVQCENAVDNTKLCSQMGDKNNAEAVEMVDTVPPERLIEKHSDPVDSSVIYDLKVDDTNPYIMGMELTVPLGKLKGGIGEVASSAVAADAVANSIPESHVVDSTNPDALGIESTVPLGNLEGEKREDPLDPLAESQLIDDTNPETVGMEFTVPLERLKGEKQEGSVDNVLLESHIMDDTIPDAMGMELTVPLGRLKEEKYNDLAGNVQQETQVVNDTNPDALGMELTVPVRTLQVEQVEDIMVNSAAETQMLSDTTPKVMGMESVVSLEEPKKEEENANFTVDVISESLKADDTNSNAIGMELTVPLGELKGEKCEDNEAESLAESQVVDDTNTKTVGMESALPVAELKEEKSYHVDSIRSESQMIDDTNPGSMMMEMTVPLIRLKGEEYKNAVDSLLSETQMMNDSNPEAIGMELTVPLGQLKEFKYKDTARAKEPQIVDEMNPSTADMELIDPFVSLENQKDINSCNDIMKDPQAECETSSKEVDVGKVEFKDAVPETKNEHQAVDTTNANSMLRRQYNPSEVQECGNLVDNVSVPIFEDDSNVKGLRVEPSVPLCGQFEKEDGDPITNEFPECKTESESNSREIQAESNVSLERCGENMIQDPEGGAIKCQEEEIIPEQVDMELSLSEAMSEFQAVDFAKMEIQEMGETSFNGSELMETNSPIKKPEISKESVRDMVTSEPLHISNTSGAANGVCVGSDVNPVLSLEEDGQQLEKSISERKVTVCEELASNSEWLLTETETNTGTNITFEEQAQKETESTVAEMDLKSHEEKSEISVSLPSQIDDNVDANCGAVNSNNDNTNQSALEHSNSIINNENGAVDLEVSPPMDSGFMPAFEKKEQPHDVPSYASVNTLEIPPKEVEMDCVTFSDSDNNMVDDDCIEHMDDTSDQENLEPNGIGSTCEIQAVHSSELASKISDADMAVNSPIQEESSKSANSIEDWIKEESSKESCEWTVYKMKENLWSFMVFHDTTLMILNLKPLQEGEDSKDNRIVESIELRSSITDDSDWCMKLVLKVMIERLPSSLLTSKCPSTKLLRNLFDFLDEEFLNMNLLLLQTYDLMRTAPVDLNSEGFSFRVTSVKRMLLFEVRVSLMNWDSKGVKKEDVQVKNVIGKMGVAEIHSVVCSVNFDEYYLKNLVKGVYNFIYTLEKVLD